MGKNFFKWENNLYLEAVEEEHAKGLGKGEYRGFGVGIVPVFTSEAMIFIFFQGNMNQSSLCPAERCPCLPLQSGLFVSPWLSESQLCVLTVFLRIQECSHTSPLLPRGWNAV